MTTQLESNEYYRVNSYYWQGMVYVALDVVGEKTLCQIKGKKSSPKWIPTNHLSKTKKEF
jgi:hypothetical protein